MTLKIEIELDNAAFEEDMTAECHRILSGIEVPDLPGWSEKLFDSNGNPVGSARITR